MLEGDDNWEDDCIASESSSISSPHHLDVGIREFNNPHYNNGYCGSNPEEPYHQSKGTGDHSHSDGNCFFSTYCTQSDKNYGILRVQLHHIRLLYIFLIFFMYRAL